MHVLSCASQLKIIPSYIKKLKLDWGSIRSSLKDGLSSPFRLNIRNSVGLFSNMSLYLLEESLLFTIFKMSYKLFHFTLYLIPIAFRPSFTEFVYCQAQGHLSCQTSNLKDDPEIESVMGWPKHHHTTFLEL